MAASLSIHDFMAFEVILLYNEFVIEIYKMKQFHVIVS